MGNYSVLRAFRALRPLRALKRLPGMPVLVQWILSVLPKMGNVLMLCGFVFLVFGIVGVELFKGSLHYRCALEGFDETPGHPTGHPTAHPADRMDSRRSLLQAMTSRTTTTTTTLTSARGGSGTQLGARSLRPVRGRTLKGLSGGGGSLDSQGEFDTGITCNPAHNDRCPSGTSCMYFDNDPMSGVNSFDSVGSALIAFMSCTTFDDWATPMYELMLAFSPFAWIYFVLIIVIAGFFVVCSAASFQPLTPRRPFTSKR